MKEIRLKPAIDENNCTKCNSCNSKDAGRDNLFWCAINCERTDKEDCTGCPIYVNYKDFKKSIREIASNCPTVNDMVVCDYFKAKEAPNEPNNAT